MKISFVPALATATMLLGGCSAYGGLGGLGGILGGDTYRDDPYRSGSYGYEPYRGDDLYGTNYSNDFERAAFNACGRRASQYGRVAIDRVEQIDRNAVRVIGRTDSRDSRRDEFGCTFRSDGRIVDFRLG
ncbi:MAG: hypothetical protein MK010_03125 [Erythrobacter sp.]|nr:hypothetical protein [Erythrobacter sp.]